MSVAKLLILVLALEVLFSYLLPVKSWQVNDTKRLCNQMSFLMPARGIFFLCLLAHCLRKGRCCSYVGCLLPVDSDGSFRTFLAVFTIHLGWLGRRVVRVLDSGAEGPGFKLQS